MWPFKSKPSNPKVDFREVNQFIEDYAVQSIDDDPRILWKYGRDKTGRIYFRYVADRYSTSYMIKLDNHTIYYYQKGNDVVIFCDHFKVKAILDGLRVSREQSFQEIVKALNKPAA